VPNLTLTGDPGVDNAALTAGGYASGAIVSIASASGSAGAAQGANGNLIVNPLDGAKGVTAGATAPEMPYGFLILGAGQFSSSITPSGSGKTPVVRAFPKFKAPVAQCSDASASYVVGSYLYCGSSANKGKFTVTAGSAGTAGAIPVGICTHTPTAAEPWLGVASLI
jgi:hypothetical protein